MKKHIILIAVVAGLTGGVTAELSAQCARGCHGHRGCYQVVEAQPDQPVDTSRWPCSGELSFTDGNGQVTCPPLRSYPGLPSRAAMMMCDRFSPHPIYAYSRHGIDAARMHEWNKYQSMNRPWHGGYNYWRWNRPTALVVPATASFQTSYAWGVGQTRSLPIYHQFGVTNPGGGAGATAFASTPYWPSSTEQFGVYPVRAPWSHQNP